MTKEQLAERYANDKLRPIGAQNHFLAGYAAGIQAERERLRALVEARINSLKNYYCPSTNIMELKQVLNWLTDPTETDKTASND